MTGEWGEIVGRLLAEANLSGHTIAAITPLTGGVSSDIVAVTLDDGRRYCAKRALQKLKVAGDWRAPIERSQYEAAWLMRAGAIAPGSAPAVLAVDRDKNTLLMEFLPAADYTLWKEELLAGRWVDGAPEAVAGALAAIHAATWGDPQIGAAFATDAMFDSLRLDPYLRTLTARYPALSEAMLGVIATTAGTKLALVHGDVSPKNILIHRRDGHPVFLDAECAWFGDPAFDAAFCINHLILKAIHVPALRDRFLVGAATFLATWLAGIPDGGRGAAEARVLALLPCLMLARVDGKSPVEYLSEDNRKRVRRLTPPLILDPPDSLDRFYSAVRAALQDDRDAVAP